MRWFSRRGVAQAVLLMLGCLGALVPGATARTGHRHDAIQVSAPPQVSRKAVYDVTITGFAGQPATAYLFIDYAGCAKSFEVEQRRAGDESAAYRVRGGFAETSGWRSSNTGTDHACAYLVATGGADILATARQGYPVS
jgi:hypothetical protein